jgi:hypothetical protein
MQHPENDPRWEEYGAETPEEYGYWSLRSCGVVAVKMIVEGLTGAKPETVMTWINAGLELDGYLTEIRPDRTDKRVEIGWKHSVLAELAREHGLAAELASEMDMRTLVEHIRAGRIVLASVSPELGGEGPVTRSSGHLVVLFGAVLDGGGEVQSMVVHNPSGRTPALRQGAQIAARRFLKGFSGRGIVIQKMQKTGREPRQSR